MTLLSVLASTITLCTILTGARKREISIKYKDKDSIFKTPVIAEGMLKDSTLEMTLQLQSSPGSTKEEISAVLVEGTNKRMQGFDISSKPIKFSDNFGKGFYRMFVTDFGVGIQYPITISGAVHVSHGYGELTPSDYGAYQYYKIALLVVFAIIISWFVSMYQNKTSLVGHHYAIGIVLSCVLSETMIHCIRLMYINKHGSSLKLMDFAETQSEVLRQTLCRLLILMVSMGWGVTLPSSEITNKMKAELLRLGLIFYFGASAAQYFLFQLTQTHQLGNKWFIFTIIGCYSLLDSVIIWTVLMNLNVILIQLKKNNQYAKYDHYKKFSLALVVLIIFAAMNALLQSYIMGREHWYDYFYLIELVRTCFWHFIFLLFMIIVMISWRPNREARIYAYVKQVQNGDNEDVDMEANFDADGQVIQIANNDGIISKAVFEIGDNDTVGDPEIELEEIEVFTPVGPDGSPLIYNLDLGGSDTDEFTTCELGDSIL